MGADIIGAGPGGGRIPMTGVVGLDFVDGGVVERLGEFWRPLPSSIDAKSCWRLGAPVGIGAPSSATIPRGVVALERTEDGVALLEPFVWLRDVEMPCWSC